MKDEPFCRFHSWHRGWKDGATSRVKNPDFQLPKQTEVAMVAEYEEGYEAGHKLANECRAVKMKAVGYTPNPLRD